MLFTIYKYFLKEQFHAHIRQVHSEFRVQKADRIATDDLLYAQMLQDLYSRRQFFRDGLYERRVDFWSRFN